MAAEGAEPWISRPASRSQSSCVSRCGFPISFSTSVAARRTGTPGSRGGSRVATPTSARTRDSGRRDPAQMMREERVTDRESEQRPGRPWGLWILTLGLLASPMIHGGALLLRRHWLNFGSLRLWDGLVYFLIAPIVGVLM